MIKQKHVQINRLDYQMRATFQRPLVDQLTSRVHQIQIVRRVIWLEQNLVVDFSNAQRFLCFHHQIIHRGGHCFDAVDAFGERPPFRLVGGSFENSVQQQRVSLQAGDGQDDEMSKRQLASLGLLFFISYKVLKQNVVCCLSFRGIFGHDEMGSVLCVSVHKVIDMTKHNAADFIDKAHVAACFLARQLVVSQLAIHVAVDVCYLCIVSKELVAKVFSSVEFYALRSQKRFRK